MDPNTTLARMIELSERWEEWGDLELEPTATLDVLSELVLSLHEWISNGGFLPDLWRK